MADAGGHSRRAQMLVYGRERKAKEMTTREMVMDTLKVSTVLGAALLLCGALGDDGLTGGPGTDTVTDFNATEGDSKTNLP